jgi:hypothetical protein
MTTEFQTRTAAYFGREPMPITTTFESTSLNDEDPTEKKKMRGRPTKTTYKVPTRVERQELLRARIMKLKE